MRLNPLERDVIVPREREAVELWYTKLGRAERLRIARVRIERQHRKQLHRAEEVVAHRVAHLNPCDPRHGPAVLPQRALDLEVPRVRTLVDRVRLAIPV